MAEAFVQQYSYNVQLDVSLRDVETAKQLSNESFSNFLLRWRGKTSKMPNCPSEKDEVRMVIKIILPTYGHQLAPIPLKNFVDLYDTGIQVEDAINSGNNGGKTSEVNVLMFEGSLLHQE